MTKISRTWQGANLTISRSSPELDLFGESARRLNRVAKYGQFGGLSTMTMIGEAPQTVAQITTSFHRTTTLPARESQVVRASADSRCVNLPSSSFG
jgi:hypothetical protein